jgi:hypothetical protein
MREISDRFGPYTTLAGERRNRDILTRCQDGVVQTGGLQSVEPLQVWRRPLVSWQAESG